MCAIKLLIIRNMVRWICFFLIITTGRSQNHYGNQPDPRESPYRNNDFYNRLNQRDPNYLGEHGELNNQRSSAFSSRFPDGQNDRTYPNYNLNYPGINRNDPRFTFQVGAFSN